MKFVVGFLAGLVVGAVGAVAYSVQTGRDLREAFEEVRSDLSRRDLDALGTRLEGRVTEMQAQLEARIAQVREKAAAAADEARAADAGGAPVAEPAAEALGETLDIAQDKPEG
jgi:gas vesicle protein